jgi:hypothetical protein
MENLCTDRKIILKCTKIRFISFYIELVKGCAYTELNLGKQSNKQLLKQD